MQEEVGERTIGKIIEIKSLVSVSRTDDDFHSGSATMRENRKVEVL